VLLFSQSMWAGNVHPLDCTFALGLSTRFDEEYGQAWLGMAGNIGGLCITLSAAATSRYGRALINSSYANIRRALVSTRSVGSVRMSRCFFVSSRSVSTSSRRPYIRSRVTRSAYTFQHSHPSAKIVGARRSGMY